MKYQVGDTVVITTGKSKGHQGNIVKILDKKDSVIIEGANKKVKHIKGRDGNPGERVEISAPVHISNIAVIDPKTNKPSRVGYKIEKDGSKVRVSKASGEPIVKTAPAKAKTKKEEPTQTIKA